MVKLVLLVFSATGLPSGRYSRVTGPKVSIIVEEAKERAQLGDVCSDLETLEYVSCVIQYSEAFKLNPVAEIINSVCRK